MSSLDIKFVLRFVPLWEIFAQVYISTDALHVHGSFSNSRFVLLAHMILHVPVCYTLDTYIPVCFHHGHVYSHRGRLPFLLTEIWWYIPPGDP